MSPRDLRLLLLLVPVFVGCAPCVTHGLLQTEDSPHGLDCTGALHPAGHPETPIEVSSLRSDREFWWRRRRGMSGGRLEITLTCPGYEPQTTRSFEWRPRILDFWDCDEIEVGTITLKKAGGSPFAPR